MRPHDRPIGTDAPPVRRTLAGTLVLAGLFVLGILAVSAPTLFAGLLLAIAAAVAALRAIRRLRRRLGRQPRRVCVPHTDVCITA
jgi:predicted PurR-regulated permease PerM